MAIKINLTEEIKRAFAEAQKLLSEHQSVLILSHEYTDGDDLGSVLALGRVLERQGKDVVLAAKGGVPDNLLFLSGNAGVREVLAPEVLARATLLVTLGCGTLSRTGFAELEQWNKPILNIDHHHDSEAFGTVNVWDETRAANCELVYLMLESWNEDIDKLMALSLLTGLFTDTGGFRHANVSPVTMEVAAELLRRGAKLDLVSRFVFSHQDLPKLRAWALALEHTRFDEQNHMVYTVITGEDLEKAQADEQDLEGVVELLNTIPDAKFSLLLKQRGGEVKGSLRSEPHKGVDVSEIARSFGGGGHKLAAGFKFQGKIERTEEGWKIT